ncbi:MAG TPA: acetyl-CoA carboxylase biotin carboxyl carrier protein subunit [bacterium]|nr:acetyl-CoA carboxylase biotin carboxyl carrier protein subunit [bacterium]
MMDRLDRAPRIALVAVLLAGAAAAAAPQAGLLEVKSTLAGTVLSDGLVEEGARVNDGQPLVYVQTALTGTKAVAARAPRDGVVREVLVRPGQRIERGDVVVRLEPR